MSRSVLFKWILLGLGAAGVVGGGSHILILRQDDPAAVLFLWRRNGTIAAAVLLVLLLGYSRLWQWWQQQINARPRAVVSLAPRRPHPWTQTNAAYEFWQRAPVGYLPFRRLDRPGDHISMELGGDQGQMVFTLTAPPDQQPGIVTQAQAEWAGTIAYRMVATAKEVRRDETGKVLVDLPYRLPDSVCRWRTFRLVEDDHLPLKTAPLGKGEPPPKQLDSLLAAVNELASGVVGGIQVLVRPAPSSWQRRWAGETNRLRMRLHNRGSSSQTQSTSGENGSSVRRSSSRYIGPVDADRLERNLTRLTARLESGTLYEVCLRVWCTSANADLADRTVAQLAQAVIAATHGPFNQLTEHRRGEDIAAVVARHFPPEGGIAITAAELGQLMHLPRPDQIMEYPRLHTAGAGVLEPDGPVMATAAETALPLMSAPAGDNGRITGGLHGLAGHRVAPPRSRVYGSTRRGDSEPVLVGHSFRDATMHTFIVGATGTGKSVLGANVVLQDWLAGHAALVIDPHRSLIDDILRGVPLRRQQDVIVLDPSDERLPFRFNLFDVVSDSGAGVERLMTAIRAGMETSWESSVGMREVLWHAITLTRLTDPEPSMVALAALLDEDRRQAALKTLVAGTPTAQQTLTFWQVQFPSWTQPDQKRALNAARRRVETFVRRPQVRRALGMAGSSVDLAAALNAGKLVLCPMHNEMGNETKRIWSTILVQEVIRTLMARRPGAALPQVTVAIDELSESIGTLAESVSTLLNETRKYGAAVVLMNQSYVSLPEEVRQVIVTNCRSHIVLSQGADNARVAQQVLGPPVTASDIQDLPPYHAYVRLALDGGQAAPCLLQTLPPMTAVAIPSQPLVQPPPEVAHPQPTPPVNPGPHLDTVGLMDWAQSVDPNNEARVSRLLTTLRGLSPARWARLMARWQQSTAWWYQSLLSQPGMMANPVQRLQLLSQLQYGVPWWQSDVDYLQQPDAQQANMPTISGLPEAPRRLGEGGRDVLADGDGPEVTVL